jgi:hypothetical protein
VVALIVNAVRRRWRRLLSVVLAPIIAGGLFAGAAWLGIDPERIRLEFTKSHYLNLIAQMPRQSNEPQFANFDWGSTGGAAVVNVFHTLVYDESDEIALPSVRRSSAWSIRATRAADGAVRLSLLGVPSENHSVTIKPIGGHFYLLTQSYP